MFDPGFDITPVRDPMGFRYGAGVFGPEVENRRLDDIRKSLMNPSCDGPETVYSIAMDVGKMEHRKILEEMHLLYGAVVYASGRACTQSGAYSFIVRVQRPFDSGGL